MQQVELVLWCVKGDTISPGDGHPRQMSRTDLDHVISTISREKLEMHLPRSAGNRGLTTQFCGGSRRQAQICSHGMNRRVTFHCASCLEGNEAKAVMHTGGTTATVHHRSSRHHDRG